ncbi:MAG: DUF3047 domain-containing protein [Paracoccaceae bacterium]
MPCACHGYHPTRRDMLRGLGAAGLTFGLSGLPRPVAARLYEDGAFAGSLQTLFDTAGGKALGRIVPFTLTPASLPWEQKLLPVAAGQPVTFLLSGRWYMSREIDLWFEPGFVFFARPEGGTLFNPMENAATMVADRDGMLEIARSAGELADAGGNLAIPVEAYTAGIGRVEGVAIAWNVDPAEGLRRLLAAGDVDGIVEHAQKRVVFPDMTPEGWHNHFHFGEAGVFRQNRDEMTCRTHKTVSILRRDVDLELAEDLHLDWDWLVDELPSRVAEDQVPTHDYLSIGVEYDDGQDLTYLWSAALPQGHVFRCPLPGWNAVETHLVQRSGLADLGKWLSETRDVAADYHAHIGGTATKVVRVWLLGVSVFQRRMGQCRYRNVSIGTAGAANRIDLI